MKTRKEFQKKIKILKQKQRRTAKCFAKLKEVLASLKKKNLLDAQQLDIKNLGKFDKELLFCRVNKIHVICFFTILHHSSFLFFSIEREKRKMNDARSYN